MLTDRSDIYIFFNLCRKFDCLSWAFFWVLGYNFALPGELGLIVAVCPPGPVHFLMCFSMVLATLKGIAHNLHLSRAVVRAAAAGSPLPAAPAWL